MDEDHDYAGIERRRTRRSRVLLRAQVEDISHAVDVRLRNLSEFGALLECAEPLPVGTEVTFERGDTVVEARVVWAEGGRLGIEFHDPIDEGELLVHIEMPKAPPAAESAPVVHRTGFHRQTLTPEEKRVAQAWFNASGRSPGD